MEFIFKGFSDAKAIRQFAFECVADDRSRTAVTVYADMTIARRYNILLQDMPLLCRRLLDEGRDKPCDGHVDFTEERMTEIRAAVRAAAEKKTARRPRPSPTAGQAWRTQQL